MTLVQYLSIPLLIYTGIKMLTGHQEDLDQDKKLIQSNKLLAWVHHHIPMTQEYVGKRFFVHRKAGWFATPLFLVLVAVESTDFIFAMDSLPAVLAISQNSFIVFSSNVAAILGLRALYFLVESLIAKLYDLKYGLAFALSFIGAKMILPNLLHLLLGIEFEIGVTASLLTVLGAVSVAVIASLIRDARLSPAGEVSKLNEGD